MTLLVCINSHVARKIILQDIRTKYRRDKITDLIVFICLGSGLDFRLQAKVYVWVGVDQGPVE